MVQLPLGGTFLAAGCLSVAHLIVEKGERTGTRIDLGDESVVVGRLKTNAISIKDPMSSRENTKIFVREAKYYVADLDSRNGTFLNGKLLEKKARVLQDGDLIQVGQTVIRFCDASAPVKKSPAKENSGRSTVKSSTPKPKQKSGIGALFLIVYFVIAVFASKILADKFLPGLIGGGDSSPIQPAPE